MSDHELRYVRWGTTCERVMIGDKHKLSITLNSKTEMWEVHTLGVPRRLIGVPRKTLVAARKIAREHFHTPIGSMRV